MASVAILAVSFSAAAKDEQWEHVTTSPKGETVYIDTGAIKSGASGTKEAWFRYEYNPPSCDAATGKCANEITEYRRLYPDKTTCSLYVFVSFTDASFSTHNLTCKIEKIAPASIAEPMWQYVYR